MGKGHDELLEDWNMAIYWKHVWKIIEE